MQQYPIITLRYIRPFFDKAIIKEIDRVYGSGYDASASKWLLNGKNMDITDKNIVGDGELFLSTHGLY